MKDNPINRKSFGKSRMEAFSDGVFAIAITLLILEVVVHPPGSLLEQIFHAWPSLVAYIISFLTIGVAWIGHTALTEHLERVDSVFLRINLLVLLVVAFLPFPTRLVAENLSSFGEERIAVTLYGLTLLAIRAIGSLMLVYAEREHLIDTKKEGAELMSERKKLIPILAGYIAAILIGLVFPRAAVAIYFGIAIYAVVPFKEVVWSLSKRS